MKDLSQIKKENPFKVPEDYFETVNKKILSATTERKTEKGHRRSFTARFRIYAVAASISGLILIGYLTLRNQGITKNDPLLSEIFNGTEAVNLINDIDIYSLENNAESAGIYGQVTDVSSDGIIEYLLSENIEINEIEGIE